MTIQNDTAPHSNRIPSLDGLRAVSILAVLFAHASHTTNFPVQLMRRAAMVLDGKLGVRVFFVISGFLITTLLLREKSRTGGISLVDFYKRRALRILPVYYFYLLTIVLLAFWGYYAVPVSSLLAAGSFTYTLWGKWGSAQTWPLEHTWSLALEEQFYFTWPAFLAFFGSRFAARIWIPTLLLLAPCLRFFWWQEPTLDRLFLTQGDSMASGCLLALLVAGRKSDMIKILQFRPALCRLGALLMIYLYLILEFSLPKLHLPFPTRLMVGLVPSIQCFAICYLMGSLILVPAGVSYWLMNCAALQWIGRLSYSLYIWQEIVLPPAESLTSPEPWQATRWLVEFPQNLVLAFALALISYHCLEQPMLKLKARFTRVSTTIPP